MQSSGFKSSTCISWSCGTTYPSQSAAPARLKFADEYSYTHGKISITVLPKLHNEHENYTKPIKNTKDALLSSLWSPFKKKGILTYSFVARFFWIWENYLKEPSNIQTQETWIISSICVLILKCIKH